MYKLKKIFGQEARKEEDYGKASFSAAPENTESGALEMFRWFILA
jgi:hypothetical protein